MYKFQVPSFSNDIDIIKCHCIFFFYENRKSIDGHDSIAPTRWHSTNTHLSSLGVLVTEPDYFPTRQQLL